MGTKRAEGVVSNVSIDLQAGDFKPALEAITLLCADFGMVIRAEMQNLTADAHRELTALFEPVKIQVWWRSQKPLKGEVGVLSIDVVTFVHERNVGIVHRLTKGIHHAG